MKKTIAARLLVLVFFAALTVIGLSGCGDYGVPVDESWEQQTLQENMHEYAVRLGLDKDAAWFEEQKIGLISESTEKDHGQSAYYLFMPVMKKLADQPHQLHTAWIVYTWLWFMAGVWAVYGFSRETGMTRPISCLGTMVLYLCPRFFAEGHYNNKDMVLLTLVLLTLWLGVRFLKKPCLLRGVLFSLAGALAANTKIAGAIGWGVMGVCAIVLVTAQKRWNRRMIGTAAVTVAAFAAFYALLTPAMWTDVNGYFGYLFENATNFARWTGVVVFRDVLFDQAVEKLPRYYLPWMMAVTLPLYVFPLAGCGQIAAGVRMWQQKKKALEDPTSMALIAATACWILPLCAAVLVNPTMYNGWRHFYFVYAGLALLAARGISAMVRFGRHYGGDCGMHLVLAAGLVLFFGWTAHGMIQNHPYQHSYYNLLGHRNAESAMELDYWELSTQNALEQLMASEERNARLRMEVGAMEDMSWHALKNARSAMHPQAKKHLWLTYRQDTPYLFSNTTYARIYGTKPPRGYHELITLESYGVRICTVYERNW